MPQTDTTYTPFYEYTLNNEVADFDSIEFSIEQVFEACHNTEQIEVKSMFTGHDLQLTHHEAKERPQASPESWMFMVIVAIIILICTYFRRRRIEVLDILQSAINHRSMSRTMREYNLNHHTSQFPIVLLWASNIALLLYFFTSGILKQWIPIHSSIIYIGLFIACTLFYLIRNGLFKFLGQTFRVGEAIDTYIMSNYIYALIESITLPALLLLIFYGTHISIISTKITLIIFGILYAFRLIRSLNLFLTYTKFSQLHLFYYLCILEFIPIMIAAYGIIYM